MTREQALKMAKAKLECIERRTSGKTELCREDCESCSLCYEQGNMGDQMKWLKMSVKALDQEPRWIPVSERMPEPRIDVWCNSDMGQMVGYYDEYAETWYGRDYFELIVTAWMPLPEPYREENESEECRDCHYNDGEPHAECVFCTKDVAKEEPTIDEVIAEINKQE